MSKRGRSVAPIAVAVVLVLTACAPSAAKKAANAKRDEAVNAITAQLTGQPGVITVAANYDSGLDTGQVMGVDMNVDSSVTAARAKELVALAEAAMWRSTIEPVDAMTVSIVNKATKTGLVEQVDSFSKKETYDRLVKSYGPRPVPQPTPTTPSVDPAEGAQPGY